MNSPENSVSVRELEKRFGSFIAVNRISLDVRRGEIFGFLGPNGAGKSTTIRMLCGILAPTGGGGTVAGLDIRTQQEQIKANIGYMSQKFSLYEDLTVEENIDFYSGIYLIPKARKRERKDWVIEMAGLRNHRNARTGTLPGGWKQRLSLGCAILHEPPVIFLDEPTSGVDPASRRNFWDMIYGLADGGSTVFVTTHYMDEAEYCDRIALIYRGEVIAMDSPAALKSESMSDSILELACNRPQDAMAIAERLPEVKEAALFGRGLHLVVDDAEAAMRAIAAAMDSDGMPYERLERIVPSMADVFVSLIEPRDRMETTQQEVRR